MTCRHAKGDPNCSSSPEGAARLARESIEASEREWKRKLEALPQTPDKDRYEVADVARVGAHLVMKVLYPNCSKCAYEGQKVMVFLDVSEADVLRWRRIDPHFSDPKKARARNEAPSPAARFPASTEGWDDALRYAREKWVEAQRVAARG